MNIKNASFYLGILVFMVGLGLSLQYVVIDLLDSRYAVFSDESEEYMESLLGSVDNTGMSNINGNKTTTELQEDSLFLSDNTTGATDVTDNLAQLNFFKRLQQKVINPLKFVFNIPSFLLSLLGLPLEPFTALTTLLNLSIYIGLIFMVIQQLK